LRTSGCCEISSAVSGIIIKIALEENNARNRASMPAGYPERGNNFYKPRTAKYQRPKATNRSLANEIYVL
jgi:hypothetical protein